MYIYIDYRNIIHGSEPQVDGKSPFPFPWQQAGFQPRGAFSSWKWIDRCGSWNFPRATWAGGWLGKAYPHLKVHKKGKNIFMQLDWTPANFQTYSLLNLLNPSPRLDWPKNIWSHCEPKKNRILGAGSNSFRLSAIFRTGPSLQPTSNTDGFDL